MIQKWFRSVLLSSFIVSIPALGFALADDSKQPATIVADSGYMDYGANITIFNGNVVMEQGSTQLTAEKVIVYTDDQDKLVKAIAYGERAHYQTLPREGDAVLHALAKTIEYYADENLVILLGDGLVEQGNRRLQGERIIYDRAKETLTSAPQPQKRTVITINPTLP